MADLIKVGGTQGNGSFAVTGGATPTVAINGTAVLTEQQATIADPAGGATVDAEARTAIAAIIDALQAHGLIA